MTRSLYILRHAKAEELAPGGADHARDLRRRGQDAARAIGRFLSALEEAPDVVLSSSAVRARHTAELAKAAGEWGAPLELERELYEAGPEELLERVRARGGDASRLLLVGHQPSLSLLIAELAGSEPAFPTAALARIDLALERWSDLCPRAGKLAWLVTPALLASLRSRSRN